MKNIRISAEAFLQGLKDKPVAICGIGHNNLPVIRQFIRCKAKITACDKRTREQLGETADQLEQEGVTLSLGERYLEGILDAQLILRTPGMKPYLPELEAARRRGATVTSEMELFFSLCPAPIYGVTGSDGKTTTTTILAGLLETTGKTVHLGGNIGRPLLPEIERVSSDDIAVVELSSFQLTQMTQSPDVAVVTNVAPNHLDWHTDMQEYIDAKKNLLLYQPKNGRAVLNADNEITAGFAADLPGEVWMFSRRHPVSRGVWLAEDGGIYVCDGNSTTFVMRAADIRLPGVHNVENYMAAIAAAWGMVKTEDILAYAREFGGVEHRCEFVRETEGVRWYNDSIASSPSRTIAGLKSFPQKVILIAGGYDKHIPYTPLGPVAAQTVKAAVLLGSTADAIETSIRQCSNLPIHRVHTMEDAVKAAQKIAESGDIVFMSPASASFDMYRNFEERGNDFKTIVNRL